MRKRGVVYEIEELEVLVHELESVIRDLEKENGRLIYELAKLKKRQIQMVIPSFHPNLIM